MGKLASIRAELPLTVVKLSLICILLLICILFLLLRIYNYLSVQPDITSSQRGEDARHILVAHSTRDAIVLMLEPSLFVATIDLCMCADIKYHIWMNSPKNKAESLSFFKTPMISDSVCKSLGLDWEYHHMLIQWSDTHRVTELWPKTNNRGTFAFLSHHPLLHTLRRIVDLCWLTWCVAKKCVRVERVIGSLWFVATKCIWLVCAFLCIASA